MDIKDVQVKKREFEFNVSKLIREFEALTDTSIDEISITSVQMNEMITAKYTEATVTIKKLLVTCPELTNPSSPSAPSQSQ